MTPQDERELIAELDDALGAGGIHDLAFHVGQVKALVKHHSELLAARDHLRARLQLQIDTWQRQAELSITFDEPWTCEQADVLLACSADLLAVLTEPQQNEMHEKTNTNAVTRSAETDVTREVPLPHRKA